MEKIHILWVARANATPQWTVKKHTHPYYHMFYSLNGTLRFEFDDHTYDLPPRHCLLIPKGVEHAYYNDGVEAVEYMEVKFSLLKSSFEAHIARRHIQISDNELVGSLFKQILKEYSKFDNRADDAAVSYLLALLNVLGEDERYRTQQQFRYFAAGDYSELSQKIIKYLETHYSDEISLDNLAKMFSRNKSHLCVAFKKDTHMTILDCLNTIRIRRAAELVVYSEYSLAQVAGECGFTSVSHFNRVFLKYIGITPGQCRRAYPADALITSGNEKEFKIENSFMYSVLAGKLITPQMIDKLDTLEIKQDSL